MYVYNYVVHNIVIISPYQLMYLTIGSEKCIHTYVHTIEQVFQKENFHICDRASEKVPSGVVCANAFAAPLIYFTNQ